MNLFAFGLCVILLPLICLCDDNTWNNNHKLREKLLKNYDKKALPQKFNNGTTTVYIGMFPRSLKIDDQKEWLVVESWLAMFWFDNRLRWDSKDFGGLSVVNFGDDELWKPDFHVYNNAEISDMDHYGNTHFMTYSYGGVAWIPPAITKSYCPVDLTLWPFDTHECHLFMGSWTRDGWTLDLKLWHNSSEIHMSQYTNTSSQWTVISAKQQKNTHKYECCDEPYVEMEFIFTVKRNSPSFSAVVVVPAVVLPLLLIAQFILPVDHSKRMTIGFVCAALVLMELLFLKLSIPRVGSSVPLIVSYYGLFFVMIVMCIILSAVLERISHPQNPLLSYPPPEIVKRLLTGPLARALCIQDNASKVGLSGKMSEDSEVFDSESKTLSYTHEWLLVAKAIDRIAFAVFVLIFIISIISFTSQLK